MSELRTKGLVKITFEDTKTGETKSSVGHNSITNLGKRKILAEGINFLNRPGVNSFNNMVVSSNFPRCTGSGSSIARDYGKIPEQDCMLLLSLEDGLEVEDGCLSWVPVYDTNGDINRDIVLGCCNFNTDITGDNYWCVENNNVNSEAILKKGISRSWTVAEDKAVGFFTHTALMKGIGIPGTGGGLLNGQVVWNCISKKANNYGTFIGPGLTGVTSDTQMLVLNTSEGVGGYIVDLETGEETATNLTYADFGITSEQYNNYRGLVVDGNKLVMFYNYTNGYSNQTVKVFNVASDGTRTLITGLSNIYCDGIFEYNGDYYLSKGNFESGTSTSYKSRLYKINSDWTSYTQIYMDAVEFIGGLPNEWDTGHISIIGKSNDKYFVKRGYYYSDVLVCTDLSDMLGSMVGFFISDTSMLNVFDTTNKSGLLVAHKVRGVLPSTDVYKSVISITEGTDAVLYGSNGLWVSEAYGNCFTFYEVDSEYNNKTDSTKAYLEYAIYHGEDEEV